MSRNLGHCSGKFPSPVSPTSPAVDQEYFKKFGTWRLKASRMAYASRQRRGLPRYTSLGFYHYTDIFSLIIPWKFITPVLTHTCLRKGI